MYGASETQDETGWTEPIVVEHHAVTIMGKTYKGRDFKVLNYSPTTPVPTMGPGRDLNALPAGTYRMVVVSRSPGRPPTSPAWTHVQVITDDDSYEHFTFDRASILSSSPRPQVVPPLARRWALLDVGMRDLGAHFVLSPMQMEYPSLQPSLRSNAAACAQRSSGAPPSGGTSSTPRSSGGRAARRACRSRCAGGCDAAAPARSGRGCACRGRSGRASTGRSRSGTSAWRSGWNRWPHSSVTMASWRSGSKQMCRPPPARRPPWGERERGGRAGCAALLTLIGGRPAGRPRDHFRSDRRSGSAQRGGVRRRASCSRRAGTDSR